MAYLIFSLEGGEPVELQITGPIVIGSSAEAEIIIEGFEVAAHHAEVYPDERGNCWARDLGSSAGIYVNGRRTVFQELHKGDELRCGEFIFQFFDFLEEKNSIAMGFY